MPLTSSAFENSGTVDAPFRKPFEIDGTDVRSLAEIKRRRTCCTLSIYFGVATTQMCRIFQKVVSLCGIHKPPTLQ